MKCSLSFLLLPFAFFIFEADAKEKKAKSVASLSLAHVIEKLEASFPLLLATEQELAFAQGELQASEGAFDINWKTEGNAEPGGFYTGRRVTTTVEQPTKLWGTRLFGSYGVSGGDFARYDGKQETRNGGEVRAGLDIPLLRDGPTDRRRANINKALHGKDVARATVNQRKIEFKRVATHAYYDWVVTGIKLKIFKDLLKTAVERTKQIVGRVRSGDLPQFDQIDNQRAELQRQSQVLSAERSFRQAALELSLYYRDENGKPIIPTIEGVPGSIPHPTFKELRGVEDIVIAAVEKRPEVSRLAAQKRQNEVEREYLENQRKPRIDLRLAASQDLGATNKRVEEGEVEMGFVIEVPLQTNVASGRLAQANSKVREINQLITFARDKISIEVKDSLIAIELAEKRIEVTQSEVKAAVELESGERERFSQGDSNLIFVNLREQTTAEAEIRELDALLEYQKALANFKAATAEGVSSEPLLEASLTSAANIIR